MGYGERVVVMIPQAALLSQPQTSGYVEASIVRWGWQDVGKDKSVGKPRT
jgi:hypothetical protein